MTKAGFPEIRIALPGWVEEIAEAGRTYASELERMSLVVTLSRENVLRGDGGPFGAAVFEMDSGVLVGAGVNCVVRLASSSLHAEIVAFMIAERRVGSHSLRAPGLPPHELVSSCEPCAMCLGATLWSGVRRVVHAASREDAVRLGFEEGPVFPQSREYLSNHGIEIVAGLLAAEARSALDLYRTRGGPVYNA